MLCPRILEAERNRRPLAHVLVLGRPIAVTNVRPVGPNSDIAPIGLKRGLSVY